MAADHRNTRISGESQLRSRPPGRLCTGKFMSGKFDLIIAESFQPHLDSQRCMLIGLCHDLAESVVGDIPTFAGVPKGKCCSRIPGITAKSLQRRNESESLWPLNTLQIW